VRSAVAFGIGGWLRTELEVASGFVFGFA